MGYPVLLLHHHRHLYGRSLRARHAFPTQTLAALLCNGGRHVHELKLAPHRTYAVARHYCARAEVGRTRRQELHDRPRTHVPGIA